MNALSRDGWLGNIFGHAVWRVSPPRGGPDRETAEAIERVPSPAFLYAKVPTSDIDAVGALVGLGFLVVDTNVVLERPAGSVPDDVDDACRFAKAGDREAVCALAGRSFTLSRLHLDPAVPRAVADRSRSEWASNFFAGQRGNHMVVAEVAGRCAGFLQLLGPKDGVLVIDLIGVDPDHRRRGLARKMIQFAAAQLRDFAAMRVGTQIANIPSLRLYEALGFRTTETSYVLHCHKR